MMIMIMMVMTVMMKMVMMIRAIFLSPVISFGANDSVGVVDFADVIDSADIIDSVVLYWFVVVVIDFDVFCCSFRMLFPFYLCCLCPYIPTLTKCLGYQCLGVVGEPSLQYQAVAINGKVALSVHFDHD